jgi:hypothetical protein
MVRGVMSQRRDINCLVLVVGMAGSKEGERSETKRKSRR